MLKLVLVSIIIPCLNEEKFIDKCLDSVIANDYPKDKLEILVVDGMSDDGTRKIVEKYVQQYLFIRILDNPKRITPCALNTGIKHAKGGIVMRMDAHTTYEKDYISKCIEYLGEYNADNVGGVWKTVPRDNTLTGKAIVLSLSHPFGIGNAYYRFISKEPRWVDTVPFFCCRKTVFEKIGLLNQDLSRGQDMEFSLRMKKAGLRILLVPEIISYYYARSDFKSFCKHNFKNGIWALYPFKFVKHMPVSLRHLIPLVFVLGLIGLGILSFFFAIFLWSFGFVLCSYVLTNLYFSTKIVLKERDARLLFILPIMFVALHGGYGLGSLWGLLKVSISKQFWRNLKSILFERR